MASSAIDEYVLLQDLADVINETKLQLYHTRSTNRFNQNAFFTLAMSLIIFLMQCGFAFLEAGAVRGKNCTSILAKNLLDSLITIIGYWSVGWAFAYGPTLDHALEPYIGLSEFFGLGIADHARFFFQYVFAARASTIISGAVAERCEFVAFIVYSVVVSSTVYPILTHWAWSPHGWLKNGYAATSYLDISGSGVVHLCGGTISIVAAYIMGPRNGRFDNAHRTDGDYAGHSVPLASLGGFILMFGFLAFNGGGAIVDISQRGAGQTVAIAMINTILCGAFSAILYMLIHQRRYGKWSVLPAINACLTGMISSCAGCSIIPFYASVFIGTGAAFIYLASSHLLLALQIDDPLNAFAVHAGGGVWGLISVCVFAKETGVVDALRGRSNMRRALWQLAWNCLSALVIITWSTLTMWPLFVALKSLGKLRVTETVERSGLDYFKHGESAYPINAYGHGWSVLARNENVNEGGHHSLKLYGGQPLKRRSRTSSAVVERENYY